MKYHKDWKFIFEVVYVSDRGFLVDSNGVHHDPKRCVEATETQMYNRSIRFVD